MAKDAKIKSLFLFLAVALSALILLSSVVMLAFASGYRELWFGVLLAALPLPLILVRLFVKPVARTSEFLPSLLLLMVLGTILAGQGMYTNFSTTWSVYQDIAPALASSVYPTMANLPGLVAGVSAILFLLYVFWYSRFGRYVDARLDVGGKMPDFEVKDLEGNQVRSTDFLGKPAVFLFFRGNWCPLCMAQVGELVERYEELQRLGIAVCLISSQPDEEMRKLADKHGVAFHFLVDDGNAVANSLGIAIANGVPVGLPGNFPGDTAMPTLFVTSAGGTIVFSDQTDNYRVRPEPDIFLAILRRAGAVS